MFVIFVVYFSSLFILFIHIPDDLNNIVIAFHLLLILFFACWRHTWQVQWLVTPSDIWETTLDGCWGLKQHHP